MDLETLCDFCDSINFDSAGVKPKHDPKSRWKVERQFTEVLQNETTCYFCQMMAEIMNEWAEYNYDNLEEFHPEEYRAVIHPFPAGDIESDDGDREVRNLLRISVRFAHISRLGPWNEPGITFQKCSQKPIHVSDFCNETSPLDSPSDHPYDGRIRPLIADTGLFAKWKDRCKTLHGENCGRKYPGKLPSRLRLVDVNQRLITMCSPQESWVALSYVWGTSEVLKCTRSNLARFQQPGSLTRKILPRTIDDAIEVTRCLGIQYLWVDSLCIIQDEDSDKLYYIPQMASIYSFAEVTIIQASGESADSGLPGIQETPRYITQAQLSAKGVTLIETLEALGGWESFSYIGESCWNKRAWTFQERLVSGKTLIFSPEQIYWECENGSWCEDSSWEHQEVKAHRHSFVEKEFRRIWDTASLEEFDVVYRKSVQEYTSRELSFESDGLNAFAGILEAFEKTANQTFFWGLPTALLGNALSWPSSAGRLRQRQALCYINSAKGIPVTSPFPSWSWVGWVGDVFFNNRFGTLVCKTLGFVFYRLEADGQPEMIPEDARLNESSLEFSSRRKRSNSLLSIWTDSSKTEITRAHIPEAVFKNHLEPTVLCFWTSTAILQLQQAEKPIPNEFRITLHLNGSVLVKDVQWYHEPRCEIGRDEVVKCIVIARNCDNYLSHMLTVMLADSKDGIDYRRGLVDIDEDAWIKLDNRLWEPVILG